MQIFSYILFNNSNSLCGSARYAAAGAGKTQDENIIDTYIYIYIYIYIDDEINFVAGLDKELDNFMAD